VVVWVKDPALLAGGPVGEAFAKSDDILAVVLAADGSVGGWVTGDRIGVGDAAFAFQNAEMNHA
jgi:glutathione S-transferase